MTSLANLTGYIWINGEFVPYSEANIHILTHSLHYSGAVFEGERAYGGKIFKLEAHTDRLIKSASILGMKVPYGFDEINRATMEILSKNNLQDAYIRPLIWRGSESLNITNKALSVNLMIAAIPSSARPVNDLNLHISRWRKPHPDAYPVQCKSSGHYTMAITAQEEAKNLGYDDAILLDYRGFIAECATTNIFFVRQNKLITPIPDAFLNGITRQTIIELAGKSDIETIEKHLTPETIKEYDECFITGTAAEVKAVSSITLKDQKITFRQNNTTGLLQKEYAELVRAV